jgi:hypothetical protein
MFSYIFFGLLSFTPITSTIDTLNHCPVFNIAMDSLEVMPLPVISNLKHGDTPVDVTFEKSILNLETRLLTLKGMVIDHKNSYEVSGVRVILGKLDSTSTGTPIFTPRASVLTDDRGEFTLNFKINKSDILIVVWLGYLEKAYSFKDIAK